MSRPDHRNATVKVFNRTSFAVRVTFIPSNGSQLTKEIIGRAEVEVPIPYVSPSTLSINAEYKPGFDPWKNVFATPFKKKLNGVTLNLIIETPGFNPPELRWG